MKGQANKKNREDKRKEKEQQVRKLKVTVGIFELGFRVFPEFFLKFPCSKDLMSHGSHTQISWRGLMYVLVLC